MIRAIIPEEEIMKSFIHKYGTKIKPLLKAKRWEKAAELIREAEEGHKEMSRLVDENEKVSKKKINEYVMLVAQSFAKGLGIIKEEDMKERTLEELTIMEKNILNYQMAIAYLSVIRMAVEYKDIQEKKLKSIVYVVNVYGDRLGSGLGEI